MKKVSFLILTLLFSTLSIAEVCDEYYQESTFAEFEDFLSAADFNNADRINFKRRKGPSTLKEIIRIESNFKVPMAGTDTYFGRIYLGRDSSTIRYRDELIAESRYKDEQAKKPDFYTSSYKVSDINSSSGLSLLKAAGASVTIKSPSKKFNTKSGGTVHLIVKHPIEGSFTLVLNIAISNGVAKNSVLIDGKSYGFDTLKINAATLGIAAGIRNIEFTNKGKLAHTFEP